jgi:hypothetical protein
MGKQNFVITGTLQVLGEPAKHIGEGITLYTPNIETIPTDSLTTLLCASQQKMLRVTTTTSKPMNVCSIIHDMLVVKEQGVPH